MPDILEPHPMGYSLRFSDNADGSWSEKVALSSVIVLTDVTLSLDTNIYADGDVLAATQVVSNAVRQDDAIGQLQSIVVIDEDDQGIAFDLVFLSANSSIGTENAAVSITDAAARDILGIVPVAAGDFKDLGGVRLATLTGLSVSLKPATGTNDVYVAAISRGAGTYSASGVKLRIGIVCN
jgi:hypothetical protein